MSEKVPALLGGKSKRQPMAGVKVDRDKALFSPSGSDRSVHFDIETAVRGAIESWRVEIAGVTSRTRANAERFRTSRFLSELHACIEKLLDSPGRGQ